MNNNTQDPKANSGDWRRARSILAKSFYNELRSNGYSTNQILELSSELLGLVTGDLRTPSNVQVAHK